MHFSTRCSRAGNAYAWHRIKRATKRLPQLDEGASVCPVKGDGMQAQQATPAGVVSDDRAAGRMAGTLEAKKAALVETARAIAGETLDPAQWATA